MNDITEFKMGNQELPFVWIFKAVKCRECMKGTICVIVIMFILSAVKMSSEDSELDSSPTYAFKGYNDASNSQTHSTQKRKGSRKKGQLPSSSHLSVSGMTQIYLTILPHQYFT